MVVGRPSAFCHEGASGWRSRWSRRELSVEQVDNMTAPTDGHNTTGQFNPLIHSDNGVYLRLSFVCKIIDVY